MALSDRIKEARLKKGLTQEQLANMIGTAKSTVTGYEKGNRIPPAATVGLIADATNVDANFLYQDEVRERKENNVSLEELSIVKKYRVLDPHGKKMVDFTLNEEWERSTEIAKENAKKEKGTLVSISKYTKEGENGNNTVEFSEELTPDKDYLLPNAAHADESLTEITEEMIQEEEDIMDDENF